MVEAVQCQSQDELTTDLGALDYLIACTTSLRTNVSR